MTVPKLSMTSGTSSKGLSKLDVLLCGTLCLLVAATFYPALFDGWSPFDDDASIVDNVHLRSFSAENLWWMFTDTQLTLRYAPLRWIVWTGVNLVFGRGPFGFHLLALVLHLINTVLVYVLVRAIFQRWYVVRDKLLPSQTPWFIALGTAFWALHPLRVETMGWPLAAQYSEAHTAAILSLLFYLRACANRDRPLHRSPDFWLSAALYLVSILFYPVALCLPLFLPVLDVYFFRRAISSSPLQAACRFFWEKWPFFLGAFVVGIMTIYGRVTSTSTFWGRPPTLAEFGVASRITQAAFVLGFYLWKPFDPAHLSPVYPYLIDFSPWSPPYLLMTTAVIAITIAVILLRRRWPWLLILWCAHIATILPFGGYFDHPLFHGDRYAYFHDVIFAIIVACFIEWVWLNASVLIRQTALVACGALLFALSTISWAQCHLWRNFETLLPHVLTELGDTPFRSEIYRQFAHWYMRDGRPLDAIDYCDKALEANPRNYFARTIKTDAFMLMASRAEASGAPPAVLQQIYIAAAENTDKLETLVPDGQNLLAAGLMYLRAGRLDVAEPRLKAAAQVLPKDPSVHLALGKLYFQTDRRDDALKELNEAEKNDRTIQTTRQEILHAWGASSASAPAPSTSSPTPERP
jgi:hypothetical protein